MQYVFMIVAMVASTVLIHAADVRLPPGLVARADGSADLVALNLRLRLVRGALADGSPAWVSEPTAITAICTGIGMSPPDLPAGQPDNDEAALVLAGRIGSVVACVSALLPDDGVEWIAGTRPGLGRLAILDAPAPTANPQLARRAAGFRLIPADAHPEGPGLSPDGRLYAALVESGPHRQQLWVHEASTGRVSATLAVPGIDGSWTDATHLRLRGLDAIVQVDAAAGRIVGVEPFHHPLWEDFGFQPSARERMRSASTIPTITDVALLPSGRHMLVAEDQVSLVELGSGRVLWRRPFITDEQAGMLCETMSPDGRWWLMRQLEAYQVARTADGSVMCTLDLEGVAMPDLSRFQAAADGESLNLLGGDGVRTTWNASTGRQIARQPGQPTPQSPPELAGDARSRPRAMPELVSGRWVADCPDGVLRTWRKSDGRLERVLGRAPIGDALAVHPLHDGGILVRHDRGWAVWDPDHGLVSWVEDGFVAGSVELDERHGLAYMVGGDQKEVVARRLPSLETVWSWSITPGGAPIAMTMTGDWFAEQDAAWAWAIALGADRVPLAGFDLALNRPDRVVAALGLAPPEDLAAWRQLCDRRLAGAPAPPGPGDAGRLPRARPGQAVIARSSCRLPVRMWGPRPVARLQVRLDGLAWPSQAGVTVAQPAVDGVMELEIPLLPGPNRVEVAAVDDAGIVGPAAMLRIEGPGAAPEPALHVIAIGVGAYPGAGPDRQLAFPAKDARDLAEALRRSHHARVDVHLLTDAEATPQRMAALHGELLGSAPGDAVVLFLAGHGTLDDGGGYRFMAAGSDLDQPASGMAWRDVVAMLDGIPARDRIVLIDTCASGGMASTMTAAPAAAGLRSRGLRSRPGSPARLPVSASFLNLDDGLGAQVVAACGADEVSLESSAVSNGLFTAALLRGLADGLPADADRDGQVTTRELAGWTVSEVGRLSGGAQRPTLRSCNPGRGAPVFLPEPFNGLLPPGISRYAPAARDPERVAEAWRHYTIDAVFAWRAAAVLASQPGLPAERRGAIWDGWLLRYGSDAPGAQDDLLREATRRCQAAGGWPSIDPQRVAPSPLPRPAWADEDGADAAGPWCVVRRDAVRLVFRWCPGGPPPDRNRINDPAVPSAWLAASPLSASEATAFSVAYEADAHQADDHPGRIVTFSHAARDQALRSIGEHLRAVVVAPPRSVWARAFAAGQARIAASRFAEIFGPEVDVLSERPWGLLLSGTREWLVDTDVGQRRNLAACQPWDWPSCHELDGEDALGCLRLCILAP